MNTKQKIFKKKERPLQSKINPIKYDIEINAGGQEASGVTTARNPKARHSKYIIPNQITEAIKNATNSAKEEIENSKVLDPSIIVKLRKKIKHLQKQE